ncbi:hypothetical protein C5167_044089 [Papaver somniferum]|uniref:CBS domain-containing protein n=1 Tax=Papaver somniferum TaxID=3469 RepID=A0A4Y7L9Z0_PAPSO|nr:hypothetical protein C5167_044089 [Papaver somniferum]
MFQVGVQLTIEGLQLLVIQARRVMAKLETYTKLTNVMVVAGAFQLVVPFMSVVCDALKFEFINWSFPLLKDVVVGDGNAELASEQLKSFLMLEMKLSGGGLKTVKKLSLLKSLTIPGGMTISDACQRMSARRVDAVLLTDANALFSGISTDKRGAEQGSVIAAAVGGVEC